MNPESIRELWQSLEEESQPMPVEELRRRAAAFETRIRRRNWGEYGSSIFVGACCLWILYAGMPWHVRAGAVLILVGVAAVCLNLYRKGAAPPAADAATASRDWYRKELERQRDLLRGVWKWYLGPLIPGLAMWFAGGLWDHPEQWRRALVSCGFAAVLFAGIGELNARTARKLDKEIASL
jgi:hypothetical protein